MVSASQIQTSNSLISESNGPHVAVFVSGTSGIGQLTLKALVATGISIRAYLVGRKSASERTASFIDELRATNPKAEIIWTEAEVSLLAETKRVCEIIKEREDRIDLLFLTTGYAPAEGRREETSEGIEITQSLAYYSRLLFIMHLLPAMNRAEAPRIVSVLAATMEGKNMNLDDIDLKQPGNFGMAKAQSHYAHCTTVALDKLAADNPHVTFIHSWPGLVNTGNAVRGTTPGSFMDYIMRYFAANVVRMVSISNSGERHLFQCTSAYYGGTGTSWDGETGTNTMGNQGRGLYLVNYKCDASPNAKAVPYLREHARDKVWGHTQGVLSRYL